MGGRGRGRGGRGGAKQSFSREQLSSMGISGNEVLPGPVTQPPMLFPMLARKPVPLTPSLESDYLLMLKQDIIDHMNLSSAYLKMNKAKENHAEQEIDKLLSQLPKTTKEVFDWNFFPSELRPKLSAKRFLKRNIKKEVDVNSRLEVLEKLEEKDGSVLNTTIKAEVEDEEVDDEEADFQDDQEDEEMDDGTDYANNYFDNGENYDDEDDNLDDGPIY